MVYSPVFVVGSPKAGSTAIHKFFKDNTRWAYRGVKDSHELHASDFQIDGYLSKFITQGEPRVFEVDQNLATSENGIYNISTQFKASFIIYIMREPKARALSAYKWLKKMGLSQNPKHALINYEKWIIGQGCYSSIIERIRTQRAEDSTFILVDYAGLFSKDPKVRNHLMDIIGANVDRSLEFEVVNYSYASRSFWVTSIVRRVYVRLSIFFPEKIIDFIKTSLFVERILFSKKRIHLTFEENEEMENVYKNIHSDEYRIYKWLVDEGGIIVE
jgi:hypothetical protein